MGRAAKINPTELRRMINQGRSTADIAAHFGVQSPAVCRACHSHGLPLPQAKEGRYPSEPGRAEDERDLAYLHLITSGETFQGVAARFRVSGMTVQRAVNAIEAADLAESGEPVRDVARHYPRRKRGGLS